MSSISVLRRQNWTYLGFINLSKFPLRRTVILSGNDTTRNMSSYPLATDRPKTNGHVAPMFTKPGEGPSAYDFRSDTLTTPTPMMLQAIASTPLFGDDVFSEDPATNELQEYVAKITGHEDALLVMSGTMSNQVAIRSHLSAPPHSVLCDVRGHIACHEAGGVSTLSGAHLITVKASNHHHLTLEDIKDHVQLSDDVHIATTKLICLENTLAGLVMPLTEVKRISTFCRENDLKLHLDGARIWEVVASGAGSLDEFCSLFDSVSLCLSKGLGAPVGSILVGNQKFIKQARRIRKMLGGGARQTGIISAAGRVAIDETFGTAPYGQDGKLKTCHENAARLGRMWQEGGGKLIWPVETNMLWLDLPAAGVTVDEMARMGDEAGIKVRYGRIVIHYQIADEALQRLEKIMKQILVAKTAHSYGAH